MQMKHITVLSNIQINCSQETRHFPLKRISINKQKNKPWITSKLLNLIKTKNNLYKKFIKSKLDIDKEKYIQKKKSTQKIDFKQTWKILNNLLGRVKNKKEEIYEIIDNNNKITDKYNMANIFNDFFSKIGQNIKTDKPTNYSKLNNMQYNKN